MLGIVNVNRKWIDEFYVKYYWADKWENKNVLFRKKDGKIDKIKIVHRKGEREKKSLQMFTNSGDEEGAEGEWDGSKSESIRRYVRAIWYDINWKYWVHLISVSGCHAIGARYF